MHERPLTPHLGRFLRSTLVLVWEQDSLTPPEAGAILQRHIPDAVLRVFPGRGYSLFHEAPAECAAAVIGFLTESGGLAA